MAFVLYGMRLSVNQLTYFILPKSVCFIINKISMLFIALLYIIIPGISKILGTN